jgi:signal-transduction protein with cAMP-binding, CBS, and nucleotidyltransferase domain
MVKHRVGSVLITEDSKLLGILTERDLFKSILKKSNLTKTRAIDIAVKKVAVIKPSATLAQAFQKMRELNFKRLPVISNNQVIGLLTIKDVLKVDPSLYSETGELHEIREADGEVILSDEHDQYGWFSVDEMDKLEPMDIYFKEVISLIK